MFRSSTPWILVGIAAAHGAGGCRAVIGYEEGQPLPGDVATATSPTDPGTTPLGSGATGTIVPGPVPDGGGTGTSGPSGVTGYQPVSGSSGGISGSSASSGAAGLTSGSSAGVPVSGHSGVTGSTPDSGSSGVSVDPNVELVNADGWVARPNAWDIQGAAYWYSDGATVVGSPGNPWDPAKSAYCISGETYEDESFQLWGGAIGIDLNGIENDATGDLKQPYDWSQHIRGFHIEYTFRGSQTVTINFAKYKYGEFGLVQPFVVGRGSGRYLIEAASVPYDWPVMNASDVILDSDPIYALQIQVLGGAYLPNPAFELCVHSIRPLPR